MPDSEENLDKIKRRTLLGDIKARAVERQLRQVFETPVSPAYKNASLANHLHPEISAEALLEIANDRDALQSILAIQDQSDRLDAIQQKMIAWKSENKPIDIAVLNALNADELDQLFNDSETFAENQERFVLESIDDTGYTKQEVEDDREEMLQIADV